MPKPFIAIHPLDPEDASAITPMKTAARAAKGMRSETIVARAQFDALMERVPPPRDVTFETGSVGDIPGLWVHPVSSRSSEAILHLHGGWFNFGSARAYRHLVGHLTARAGASAFVPDYRLAPEHPFPAAVDDVLACYRGIEESGIRRIVITETLPVETSRWSLPRASTPGRFPPSPLLLERLQCHRSLI